MSVVILERLSFMHGLLIWLKCVNLMYVCVCMLCVCVYILIRFKSVNEQNEWMWVCVCDCFWNGKTVAHGNLLMARMKMWRRQVHSNVMFHITFVEINGMELWFERDTFGRRRKKTIFCYKLIGESERLSNSKSKFLLISIFCYQQHSPVASM